MVPQTKQTNPAADIVRDYLMRTVASGGLAPGAKLPTERALATALGVPRSTVRDVFAGLESQGKIVRIVGSGTYLAEVEHAANQTAPLASLSRDVSPREIMDARFVIEPQVARLAAINATSGDLLQLESILRDGDRSNDFASFEAADNAFHEAVARATNSRLVTALSATVGDARRFAAWGDIRRQFLNAGRRTASQAEHWAIFEAISARDSDAAERAVLHHLDAIEGALLQRAGQGRSA